MLVAGAVSGAVYAQTNVTIYGRADVSYVYSKSDFRKFQGVENGVGLNGGSSYIGFKGEEALGNGLKAVFKFEWGVLIDSGDGPTARRYTYAGLAGNFGQLIGGYIGNPADTYMGATSAQGLASFEPMKRGFRGKMPIIDGVSWGNSIAYSSPNFSGLDFMAIYSFGERKNDAEPGPVASGGSGFKSADTSDAGQFGLGVRYANGPLYLTAVYHARQDDDSLQPSPNPTNSSAGYGAKGWAIGGSYDFNVVKVYANYMRAKANNGGVAPGANDGTDKQTTWSLGIGIPVSSAGTVSFEYARYKDYVNNGIRDGADPDAGHKAKGYSVGYRHNLSKRTWLHASVARISNDRGINAGWDKTGVAGKNQTNFETGITHLF
jgi:predicted porin